MEGGTVKRSPLKRKQAARGREWLPMSIPLQNVASFPMARGPGGSQVDRKDATDYRLLKAEGNPRAGSVGEGEGVG